MIKVVFVGVVGFSIVYLLGAFVQTDLDFTQWSEPARVGVAAIGGFVGGMMSFLTALSIYD